MGRGVAGTPPPSHRSQSMKTVTLPGGERVPALGMGT